METNQEQKSKENPYLTPIAIIIAGLIIAAAVYFARTKPPQQLGQNFPNQLPPTIQPSQPNVEVDVNKVDTANEPFIGNPNAPVVMAYWLDYQCPFCKRFEEQTLPQLVEKYVKTGKLKIVFKDYQFLGPDSQDGGLVENAVWELYPNLFFKWHQLMFEAQDEENGGFGNLESILKLIREKIPEMDADKIAQKVNEKRNEYLQEMDADRMEGVNFGIDGTPGFVIGKQRIVGAQPLNVFVQAIEAELKNK